MTGEDVREVYETVLPSDVVMAFVRESGFQERQRRLDAVRFTRATVIAASTGRGGRQAEALRLYFEGACRVVRGSAYAWFGERFERLMERVKDRALSYGRSLPLDLPGVLGAHVQDWHIVDSCTVRLDDRLKEEYPGTGDYAALKVHKRFSVGLGTTWDYHLSPAREHDAPHLRVDASWRGLGLLVDLGYASLQLLRDCEQHGVKYVIRLKENWKPKVQRIERGKLGKTFLKGTDLDTLVFDEVLLLKGRSIDLDVTFGRGKGAVSCRLVGVRGPKGRWYWYLTNLPRDVKPAQVLDLYRVRWEIEQDNKLDKSCQQLDEVGARTGPAVRGLVHASIVASVLICLVAHKHRLREAPPPRRGAERTKPPIHPQTMARMVGTCADSIARALDLDGEEAEDEWDRLAELLYYNGCDPNWRTRPSVLDQLRGWRITPGRPRRQRAASVRARRAQTITNAALGNEEMNVWRPAQVRVPRLDDRDEPGAHVVSAGCGLVEVVEQAGGDAGQLSQQAAIV